MRNLLKLFFLTCTLHCFYQGNAQLQILATPSVPCAGTSGTVQLGLNTLVQNANTYSWAASPSGTLTPTAPNGSVIIGSFSPGTYTVTVFPFATLSGTPILIPASITSTVINIAPGPTINLSLNTSTNLCLGNTTTISATGASSYTWAGGSNNGSIVTTPLQSTVITVFGQSTGTCISYANVTLNVASAAPNLTLSQPASFSLCNNFAMLQASGAVSYSWSTGATTASQISITGLGCYSVTGTNGCGSSTTSACAVGSNTPSAISLNFPTLVCSPGTVTLSVGNSTNFSTITWLDSTATTVNSSVFTPNISSPVCYTVSAISGNCTTSSVICIPFSSFTLATNPAGNFSLCSTNPSLSASGANSYTWTWAGGSSTNSVISPTAIGCYTLVGSGNAACPTNSSAACLNAFLPAPNPTIVASDSIGCTGSTFTLSASGTGGIYSWNGSVDYQPITATGTQVIFSPTLSSVGCFTLTENVTGCSGSAVQCHSIFPSSPAQIMGLDTLCAGDTTTLYSYSASSYSWSTGSIQYSAFITPTTSTCYTLIGYFGACTLQPATWCVVVKPTPVIVIVPSNTSICNGSSVTYSAFGAVNYIWNGASGTNGPTFNTLPAPSVTVEGSGANGCAAFATASVVIDTTCSDVWPGDANSDGFVNGFDVLELGLHANAIGPQRAVTGNSFVPHFANNWSGLLSSGKNVCHSDCNGDGVINSNDTVAIYNNFGFSHNFKPQASSNSEQLQLVAPPNGIEIGRWNNLDLLLGAGSNSVQTYGLCFEINFDPNVLETDSIWIEFASSGLMQNNQTIYFRKLNFLAGKLFVALTRTDLADFTINEKIAILHIKSKSTLIVNTPVSFELANVSKSNSNGIISAINGDLHSTILSDNLTSLTEGDLLTTMSIFPNPAKDIVLVRGKNAIEYTVRVFDLSGRVLINTAFTAQTTVNLTALENGIYFVEVAAASGVKSQRITVLH